MHLPSPPDFRLLFYPVNSGMLPTSGQVSYIDGEGYGTGLVDISRLDSAVPEPSTWAFLLVGFVAIGCMLRTQRCKQTASVFYISARVPIALMVPVSQNGSN